MLTEFFPTGKQISDFVFNENDEERFKLLLEDEEEREKVGFYNIPAWPYSEQVRKLVSFGRIR